MDYNALYDRLAIDKRLVTDFLILFSYFEYSLKKTIGYANGNENKVEADWTKFACDHAQKFDSKKTKELEFAFEYLISQPPKKQVLKNGVLDFELVITQNVSKLGQVLLAIRLTRNNLFHGGKFPSGHVKKTERDPKLLKCCLTVLEECLTLNDEIRINFKSYPT